ncbi:hypothetical protein RN001_011445 [Aquatica leii]|uniref:Nucleolus and neural progenitor protein-like N-terminal domain-containing protein n=1 Tax=Aquatica leii TaxID=1421715 RepID=A0AAN7SM09_9COLE|nr:hypothetical protein RN001_011445 [Aquatica leii]
MNNINLWNRKNLEPPPIASYKTNSLSVDVFALQNILKDALHTFKNQSVFDREAAFLSRFIYCSKTKLRHNKAIKVLQKINQALLRYLRMDLVKHFQVFLDMIPYDNESVYLPTRSMLQYLLVRLQGAAQLMVRIVETSKIAGYLLNQHISIGHMWKVLFLSLGIVSRIYVLSKNLAKFCCTLYTQLLPFTKSLEDLKHHWLPNDYILPSDLKQWLNTDCLDTTTSQDADVTDGLSYLSLLNSLNDDDWFEVSNANIEKVERSNNIKVNIVEEDFGVPIDEIKVFTKKRKRNRTSINKPKLVDSINSLADLKKFHKDFEQNPEMYTDNLKKIDRMQCNMLQNTLFKYIRKMDKYSQDSAKVSLYLIKAKKLLHCL